MKIEKLIVIALVGMASGCGSVQNETRGEVTVYGKSYTTVTREFQQNGGLVTTGAVVFNNRTYGCNTLLAGDCELRVELLLDSDSLGRNSVGPATTPYVITDPNKPGVRPVQIRF